jgi:hypothetical protein
LSDSNLFNPHPIACRSCSGCSVTPFFFVAVLNSILFAKVHALIEASSTGKLSSVVRLFHFTSNSSVSVLHASAFL